jgi:hypothetical protein
MQTLIDILKPGSSWLLASVLVIWYFGRIYRDQIKTLMEERQDYKDKLHTEKDEHYATTLKLAEAETRPDLTSIEQLLKIYSASTEKISSTLEAHVHEDAKSFLAIQTALDVIPSRLSEQSDLFTKALKNQADAFNVRQSEMIRELRKKKR